MTNKTIDESLSVRKDHLFIEECDTTELVKNFGSPLFVVSENQLRRNYRRYLQAFGAHWPDGPTELLPANKANCIQRSNAESNANSSRSTEAVNPTICYVNVSRPGCVSPWKI